MIKSMDSAVSAIKAQQTRLDVTANNIANVNTVGFKKSRTVFSTLLSTTLRSASGPTENRGGINPSVIGMGVQVSSIDAIHTQGIVSSTGRGLDLAIQGDGFFTVTDGNNIYYTRNGAINLSPTDGSLCLSNGYKLMGYPIDSNGKVDKNAGLQPITVPTGTDVVVQSTTNVSFAGNIDSSSAVGDVVSIPFSVYDSLGNKHDFKIEVTITGVGEAEWEVMGGAGLTLGGNTGTLKFDANGAVENATGGPLTFTPIGANPMNIEMDFSNTSMVNKTSDFSMKSQNGMPAGSVQSVSVTNGGNITITYSNGMSKDIAALGIAIFDNPAGLTVGNDSLFESSTNSGAVVMFAGGESTKATVLSGYLEGSNVDVSEELTDMIKTQRAYQMATKVITTSDEILQELTNIKR